MDQIFTLQQILGYRNTFRRPIIVVFLDLNAMFDSVDREVLWQCLSLRGVPDKCIILVRAPYLDTFGRVRVYDKLIGIGYSMWRSSRLSAFPILI